MSTFISTFASDNLIQLIQRHTCQECGSCCRWEGNVFLYPSDITNIAAAGTIEHDDFIRKNCEVVHWTYGDKNQYRLALSRRSMDHACIFLHDNRCSIQATKPLVCRAGPAGWHWISLHQNFSVYFSRCPGFFNNNDMQDICAIDKLFQETWRAESDSYSIDSIDMLADRYKGTVSLFESLTRREMKYNSTPYSSLEIEVLP